jgi:hypothetical protein
VKSSWLVRSSCVPRSITTARVAAWQASNLAPDAATHELDLQWSVVDWVEPLSRPRGHGDDAVRARDVQSSGHGYDALPLPGRRSQDETIQGNAPGSSAVSQPQKPDWQRPLTFRLVRDLAVEGRDDSDRAVSRVDRSYPRNLPRPK